MASVTPVLRTSKRDRRGRCPVWLRVADRDRTRFLSLGVKVLPSQWNPNQARVRKGHPNADLINRLISTKLDEAEAAILKQRLEGEYATAEHVKDVLAGNTSSDFFAFSERHLADLQKRGKVGRYRRLKSTLKKLRAFTGSPLAFDRVTPRLLGEFETHLLQKGAKGKANKQSTIATNLSDLRALYRRAVTEGVVQEERDPFRRFTIKQGTATERVKLTFGEVHALEALDLSDDAFGRLTRDVFLFAFYSGGLRFADVATMKQGRVATGDEGEPDRLFFRAGKTGKAGSVKITPPARRILERYLTPERAGAEAFVFPLLEGYDLSTPRKLYNAKSSRNAAVNRCLKRLAKQAGITGTDGEPKPISTHIARHSFADAARTAGWSIYDISKALQHSSIEMTERYLRAFDHEAHDERMMEMFDD